MKRSAILFLILTALARIAPAQELPILSTDAPIGPQDVLDISVLEDKSIAGRVTVKEDGTIVLNVLEKVQVAGLSASQVEGRLKSLLE
jgi:protein involved in polysaccharide export with SLBB domain